MGIVCDVRRYEDCSAVVTAVENRWGPVDTLVATVGIIRHCPIEEMSEKDWQDVLDINLTGVYHAVTRLLDALEKKYREDHRQMAKVLSFEEYGKEGHADV